MKLIKLNIIIVLITLSIVTKNVYCQNDSSATCQSAFDCPNTICCINKVCVDNEECQKDKVKVYAGVGAMGAIFIVISLIYMWWVINDSKKNIRKARDDLRSVSELNLNNNENNEINNKNSGDVIVNKIGNNN